MRYLRDEAAMPGGREHWAAIDRPCCSVTAMWRTITMPFHPLLHHSAFFHFCLATFSARLSSSSPFFSRPLSLPLSISSLLLSYISNSAVSPVTSAQVPSWLV